MPHGISDGMSEQKPSTVYLFDILYWFSTIVSFLNGYLIADPEPRGALLVAGVIRALTAIGIAGAIWYFASVRRSYIALVVLTATVLLRFFLSYYWLPERVWSSATWLLLNMGPLLLLAVAVSAMMTPSARSWRRRDDEHLTDVFD